MIGTTMALVGLAAASTAGSVASSAMQSRAASNANKSQQAAINRAMSLQQQLWGQQREAYSPYINLGQGAASLMGRLMLPPGMMPQGGPPPMPSMQQGPGMAVPRFMSGGNRALYGRVN